jgi:parallel beta-helix repeat protein
MKHALLVSLLAAILILTALPCLATDYYVAQKAPAADDKNPGTLEKPFKTITTGLPHLKPGDTLYVREGVYRESVAMIKEAWDFAGKQYPAMPSGQSEGKRIGLCAYEGEKPVIKGSDVVAGWKKHKDNTWVKDWTVNSQQVFCDGVLMQQIAGQIDPGNLWAWIGRKGNSLADLEAGSFYVDIKDKKLYVWLKDGSDPNQHEMEVSVRPVLLWVRLDYVYLRGLTCTHSNMVAYVTWPSSVLQGAHNIAEDCEFSWCDFCGLSVSGKFNTLVRCKMNHNGDCGFGGGGRGDRYIDCEFSFNNNRHWNAGWHAGGMKVNGYDFIFSGCTFEGNFESPGWWNDGECSNITVENCRAMHNGMGIMVEIGRKVVIRNNQVYENYGRGIYISSSSNCDILHNTLYRNGGSGVAVVGPDRINGWFFDDDKTGFAPARNNVVWGNIFYDNCNPDFCPKELDGRGKTWDTRAELILPNPAISSNDGCVSDYNIFWRSPGHVLPFWYNWHEVEIPDLAAWQNKTGQDMHSIIAKPLFADAAKFDFHPVKGSPAIAFVKPHMGANIDADDKLRSREGYYTAGAFEAPPEMSPPARPKPPADLSPKPQDLPADRLVELPAKGDLTALTEAMRELDIKTDAQGKSVAVFHGIPFEIAKTPKGIILEGKVRNVIIPMGKGVRKLYLLFAVIDPPKDPMNYAYCKVLREDGMGTWLTWMDGKNIGTSLGEWKAIKPTTQPKGDLTDVAWQSKDGKVRLFMTTWDNDNYWYPIRRLDWGLSEKGSLVILGVTITPDK